MTQYMTLSVASSNTAHLSSRLTLNVLSDSMNRNNNIPKQPRIAKYTLEIFLQRAQALHGNKYDYSSVTPNHIQGRSSHVPVKCNTCAYEWNPDIHSHITHKSGCPMCAGNLQWTLERVLIKAKEIHGDTIDYSEVKEEHIKNVESHIPLVCMICSHRWEPNIHSHINHKTGCPGCIKRIPWTLDRFLARAKKVHGDAYDYSTITEAHINGAYSDIPVTCKKCHHKWTPTIDGHVKGHGCPRCKASTGEKACELALKNIGINYTSQVKIAALPHRVFDFGFEYMGKRWLLEFDGAQHFYMNDFFHITTETFRARQRIDIMKTRTAVTEGYRVIHIDYTQIDNIEYHIRAAINLEQSVYFSTLDLYKHYN